MTDDPSGVIAVPCSAGSTVARFVADVTAGRINGWMSLPAPITSDDLRRVATRFSSQLA